MDGKKWDELDEKDYQDFINYGMYDVFALAELYIKIDKILNVAQVDYSDKFKVVNEGKEE